MTPSQNRVFGSQNSRFPDFSILTVSSTRLPILWITYKGTMTPSQNRILGFPNSRLFDFDRFEPQITDFVKKIWRKMTPSQNRTSGFQNSRFLDFSKSPPRAPQKLKNVLPRITQNLWWIHHRFRNLCKFWNLWWIHHRFWNLWWIHHRFLKPMVNSP